MSKSVKELMIQLELKKDVNGKVQLEGSGHVLLGTTEYHDITSRKGFPIDVIPATVVKFANDVLQGVMTTNAAIDGIPVPPPPPPPKVHKPELEPDPLT